MFITRRAETAAVQIGEGAEVRTAKVRPQQVDDRLLRMTSHPIELACIGLAEKAGLMNRCTFEAQCFPAVKMLVEVVGQVACQRLIIAVDSRSRLSQRGG